MKRILSDVEQVENGNTMHVVKSAPSATPAAPTPAATETAPPSTTPAAVPAANPMAALLGGHLVQMSDLECFEAWEVRLRRVELTQWQR